MTKMTFDALQWFLGKQNEYLQKAEDLWEIKDILGDETYEKCREFYHGESRKYADMANAIERYSDMDGAENDLVAQFGLVDIPAEAEREEARKAAEEAMEYYTKRS